MAPHEHEPQVQCTGLLLWEESSSGLFNGTCWGVATPLKGAYVDLIEHNSSRAPPSADSKLYNLTCIGSAVYQHVADETTGIIPPPACLGVEFQRYKQLATQAAAAAGSSHASLYPQHIPAVARDVELLHAEQHVSTGPAGSSTGNSSSAEAYMRHASSSSSSSASTPIVEGPEYQGRPSPWQRLQELHAELSERLDGQDPLWFGKAFAARAALNWDSMKSMAGEVLKSAKADLGLQTKSEEQNE